MLGDDDDPFPGTSSLLGYGDEPARRKKLKQYRCTILVLSIVCIGLLTTIICGAALGLGCHHFLKLKRTTIRSDFSFFHLSDLHVDKYYNPQLSEKTFCRNVASQFNITARRAEFNASYGRVSCDAPKKLLDLAVNKVKSLLEKHHDIKFMLITGDISAHKLDRYFVSGSQSERVLDTMRTVWQDVAKSLPDIPLITAFGNNDLPGDYMLPHNATFYHKVLDIWKPLMIKTCNGCTGPVIEEKELERTFLRGGYYKAHLKAAGHDMTVLVLNTNYWAIKCYAKVRKPPANAFPVADQQLQWLEDELKLAAQRRRTVLIAGHVPPGIDAYDGKALWFANYTQMYMKLVSQSYKETVVGQLYGHFHKDEFKLQDYAEFDKNAVGNAMHNFLLVGPGVTPVYSNNPSFRVVEMSKQDGRLLDYDQYYLDLVLATEFGSPSWLLDYRFSEEYGLRPVADDMVKLCARLVDPKDKSKTWSKFIWNRQVQYQPKPYSRFHLYCSTRYNTQAGYDKCIAKYKVTGG